MGINLKYSSANLRQADCLQHLSTTAVTLKATTEVHATHLPQVCTTCVI